jgi:RimJ/RimL family protein N-acetyltransferase
MTTTRHTLSMPTTLFTPRLRLRTPVMADASRIAMFIGDWDVVKFLASPPYPYTEADAKQWLAKQPPETGANYVVVHANGVIGVVGVEIRQATGEFELGYWLAKPFWGRGFMTEAVGVVIRALRTCDPKAPLNVAHFEDNAGSAGVIRKLGFVPTGERRIDSASRGTSVRSLTYRLPFDAERAPRRADTAELETAGGAP